MRIYLSLICFFITFSSPSVLHSQNQTLVGIYNAIISSDSKNLSSHFSRQLIVSIDENEYNCSKKQAESIIKKFFKDHKIQKLTVIQQNIEEQTSYIICRYTTTNDNFRFYINLKTFNDGLKIFQIIIKNERE
ncbi:MAG TPA: DUF4783 domain-containing protein [Salinivirgaceae bacterium]|nr:DUF4783 domain-containing protein [Salinivirgaceae bacterium]